MNQPENASGRKFREHAVPSWVDPDNRDFFVTVCCQRRGTNQLCLPTIGQPLLDTARFYHQQQIWIPSVFLLMPDHVHMIVSFGRGRTLEQTVRSWKRYTARAHGIEWQRDFFRPSVAYAVRLLQQGRLYFAESSSRRVGSKRGGLGFCVEGDVI